MRFFLSSFPVPIPLGPSPLITCSVIWLSFLISCLLPTLNPFVILLLVLFLKCRSELAYKDCHGSNCSQDQVRTLARYTDSLSAYYLSTFICFQCSLMTALPHSCWLPFPPEGPVLSSLDLCLYLSVCYLITVKSSGSGSHCGFDTI